MKLSCVSEFYNITIAYKIDEGYEYKLDLK